MSIPIPNSKPKASIDLVLSTAAAQWRKEHEGMPLPARFVLAVRGYYSTTIGDAGNDINAYDDAFFIVNNDKMTAWNGNTDPTRYGWNSHADGYMARLKSGCWWFIKRMHRGKYQAYGQGENTVTIDRVKSDGTIARTHSGDSFGIDLHVGGYNGTSSEGCQTVPVEQWNAFRDTLNAMLVEGKMDKFAYILVEGPIN